MHAQLNCASLACIWESEVATSHNTSTPLQHTQKASCRYILFLNKGLQGSY